MLYSARLASFIWVETGYIMQKACSDSNGQFGNCLQISVLGSTLQSLYAIMEKFLLSFAYVH